MPSFSGPLLETTWTNEKKGGPFPSPNKTSGVRASLRCIKCAALNAALNETALHLMQRGFNLAVTRGHLPLTN